MIVIGVLLTIIFIVLSGIHWYWMLGGRWGLNSVIPEVEGRKSFQPSSFASGLVALALLVAAGLCALEAGLFGLAGNTLSRFGVGFLAAVFFVRAVGDFRLVGFFKRIRGTPFAKMDSFLFTPLCLLLGVGALLLVLTGGSPVRAESLADSVADFSGRQGLNGWTYGYWNESQDADGQYDQTSDFQLFSHFGTDKINGLSSHSEFTTGDLWFLEDGRYYTSLWAEGGHPHGTMDLGSYARANHWVVRRWISTVSGRVAISGHAGKVMPWGENWGGNSKFLIVVGGDPVFAAEVDDAGQDYSVSAEVEEGTPVDFLIGPGSAIGVMRFTANISRPQSSDSR